MRFVILLVTVILVSSFSPQVNCPPTGLSRKGTLPKPQLRELNKLKNRDVKPTAAQINKNITLETLFNSLDDKRAFSESEAVTIEGYLVDAKDEKGESCNCYSTLDADMTYMFLFRRTKM
jgi:hypothetical protein